MVIFYLDYFSDRSMEFNLELVPKPQDVGLTQKFNNIRTT
ncbi:hypothetical protein LEP1GSC075_3662 [Leptospira interrogans str. Kito]|nr:hypothetical protein LEP1GSC069_2585 [Leptospira interrogans serovar Canicola str. Fiocruz LV133]EMK19396.1 hypothetical protein LEP1GSC075_3662 [Leptospira interrogans str. Kito]EMN75955.1 hypothetical protein LEP1GSC102_3089 [Leptospira interrogans str. UI 09600]